VNWEAAGAIGEIVGAIGVLATLIYLAVQIRDNTRSLHAASLQSVLDGPRDRHFLPMASCPGQTDLFSRGLNSLDDLDPDEKRRFYYQLYEQLFQMQQVMHLRERNLIPQVDYDAWLTYTASLLRTPGGSVMWRYCEIAITPTVADILNRELDRDPDAPSFTDLIPLFRRDEESTSDV
jgi:hypothetical protein